MEALLRRDAPALRPPPDAEVLATARAQRWEPAEVPGCCGWRRLLGPFPWPPADARSRLLCPPVNSRPQWVLGVNPGLNDGSAALLCDGELVCLVESERLTRVKRATFTSPALAITACLDEANIHWDDLSAIALGWDIPEFLRTRSVPFSMDNFLWWLTDPLADVGVVFGGKKAPNFELNGTIRERIRFVPHHRAHAMSALFYGGFDDKAILVLDGAGENESGSLWHASGGDVTLLESLGHRSSLGRYYGMASEWSGLGYWNVGKFMGLASYGTPVQQVPLRVDKSGYHFVDAEEQPIPHDFAPDRSHAWIRQTLQAFFAAHCSPATAGDGTNVTDYADFAASVQASLNVVVDGLCQRVMRLTGESRIALAGGVGLNCTLNGFLVRNGLGDRYFVPPVPHDTGVSVGAAYAVHRATASGRRPRGSSPGTAVAGLRLAGPRTAVCGGGMLRQERLSPSEMTHRVAELLVDDRIVCWAEGRSEVGQRALGQRSLLSNPQRVATRDRVNTAKGRELWRPLAPSVHEDGWSLLFDVPPHALHRYMLMADQVTEAGRRLIPAAVHVDGSARPQIVRRSEQPLYAGVIEEFWRRTGVPAVLNTSLNLAGEPVVLSADDAIDLFQRSTFDALVCGDTLLIRPP